jgi:hypothetical protein
MTIWRFCWYAEARAGPSETIASETTKPQVASTTTYSTLTAPRSLARARKSEALTFRSSCPRIACGRSENRTNAGRASKTSQIVEFARGACTPVTLLPTAGCQLARCCQPPVVSSWLHSTGRRLAFRSGTAARTARTIATAAARSRSESSALTRTTERRGECEVEEHETNSALSPRPSRPSF